MKVQRLSSCEYESYRFTPASNPLDGLKNNILIRTSYDKKMFRKMLAAYTADPNHFGVKMKNVCYHPELAELYAWMTAKTPKLDSTGFEYKFRHRLVWIVNGLTDFPRCPVCGKLIGFEDNTACWYSSQKDPAARAWNYKTHCCKLHAEMDPEHQQLVEAGVMASLGVTHPMKDKKIADQVIAKGCKTYKKRTGYNTHFENPEYQKENAERIRQYWNDPIRHDQMVAKAKRKRDAKSPEEKADIERRRQNSRVKTTGSPNYHWSTRYYEYEGITFDSSWEVYAWIWHKDNDHEIKRCDTRLEYEFDGKIHGYYPDFVVDGKLTEIKGDQFFSVRGDITSPMWHPYHRNRKTAEQLKLLDGKAQAKQRCMNRHNVYILVWKDILPMKTYVDRKYGKGYVSKFMRKRISENTL